MILELLQKITNHFPFMSLLFDGLEIVNKRVGISVQWLRVQSFYNLTINIHGRYQEIREKYFFITIYEGLKPLYMR